VAPPLPDWPGARSGAWWQELGQALARLVGGRFLFLAGMALVAAGGALLGSAWRLGPATLAEVRGRAKLTARMEAEAVRPFWRIDVGREPFGGDLAWPHMASAELCAELRPVERGGASPGLVCGARRHGWGSWDLVDSWSLAPGVPIVWPRDERGWPIVEVRATAEVMRALRERPALHWPLLGQSEEARAAMPAPGSEWDALWLEIDRPIEWLARSGAAPEAARFELALDPENPGSGIPAPLLANPPAEPLPMVAILVLAALGGVGWWKGISIAFHGQPRWAIAAVASVPLLLLPWWGNRFSEVVRRLAPGFGEPGLWLERELAEARRPPVEVRPVAGELALERQVWRIGESYYRATLEPFEPLVPERNGSADDALALAAATVRERFAALDESAQSALLDRLAWDEQLDRGQASLLFAPAAFALLEDGSRSEELRQRAGWFLFWLGVTPLGIHPEQPAFAARRAIWEELHRSHDPAVANTAGWVLEKLPAEGTPAG
jgi:hypothetical protein